jgi:protein-S-isoprenylcysteine O-methyltransferase Ste14
VDTGEPSTVTLVVSLETSLSRLSVPALRWKNFFASTAVVALSCAIYVAAPYNQDRIGRLYGTEAFHFRGGDFLLAAAALYVACLLAYCLSQVEPGVCKSLRFFRVVGRFARTPVAVARGTLCTEDRVAVLTTLLKGFFAPFMVVALMQHVFGMVANGFGLAADLSSSAMWLDVFNRHGFMFTMQLILFVDVVVFTFGYLVEMPALKNEIRSVDPTLLGWAAALLCYPPFNAITGAILGRNVSDFPRFDDATTHILLNLALLGLMAVYASASVALGLKASNLTHRGIVARGPYAWVRHPAYAAKNMAWWIGAIPVVSAAFGASLFAGVSALASVIGWSMLYALRAVTEEDHLRSVDGEYAVYAARVRYRFIPGIY